MIEDILPRYQEVATGNKTAFTVPFETIDSSYINVYLNSTKQTTGYTVSGKTITFGTAPASGTLVTVVRVIPISWEHTVLGAIDQNSLNKIFTDIIAKMQTLEEGLNRAIKTDVTDTESGSDYFLSLLADAMDSLAQAQTKLTQVQSAATQALSDISTAKTTAISDFNTNASTKTTDFNTNAAAKQALVDAAAEAAEESAELAEQYAESINPENFDTVKGKISNCILEIPQNIKLKISDKTLILKSDSTLALVNRSTYTTVTTAQDYSITYTNQNGTFFIIYAGGGITGTWTSVSNFGSGTTLPADNSQYGMFFLINSGYGTYYNWNFQANNWRTWNENGSYPLAIVNVVNGVPSFAKDSHGNDMIFNGAGFIGHHAFVYPNVKGLISQEKETDGRLKSINQKLSGLYITELSTTNNVLMINSYLARFAHANYGGEVDSMDELPNLTPLYYVKNRNRMVKGSNKNTYNGVILADCTYDGTTVTDFTIRQPVRLATTEMLDKKQDTLTFDTTPTQSSTNPVTSGGVYTALGTKQDTLVSGTNIKTINSTSVLGSGDLTLADQSLSNLNSTGQMIVDSQNDTISNCILEIPQNLKCELSGTTYTLKAGSIRTVFGATYTTITTESDISVTLDVSTDGRFVMIGSTNAQAQLAIERFDSGATTPSSKTTDYFWNTTDKLMYLWRTANSEYQAFTTWCYPSCLIDVVGGVASFAKDSKGHDLIFNGCGYIGHHWFVFPDVTGLIPYNFDDDKKLKSIKYTTTSLVVGEMLTYPYNNYYNRGLFLYPTDGVTTSGWAEPINSLSDDPSVGYLAIYVKDENRWHRKRGSGTSFAPVSYCLLVDYKYDGTTVNDFVIYQPYEDARDLLTDEIKKGITTKANDSDVVKLTGDQNIAGSKTYSSGIKVLGTSSAPYSLQRTGITKGTAPSSTIESRWYMTESGGVTASYSFGGMRVSYNSNGDVTTSLRAFKSEASSTTYAEIGVVYPTSGDAYTFAPTPTVGDNSTKIATTAYVNAKFQVVSSLPASPDADTFYFVTGA